LTPKTKIIATIGPATANLKTLKALIKQGLAVARLNMAHGSHAQHKEVIALVRQASQQLQQPVAILADLEGPKIRTGSFITEPVELKIAQKVTLTTKPVKGTSQLIPIAYSRLTEDVKVGQRLLLADGAIELLVLSKNKDELQAEVKVGGFLRSNQGLNLPETALKIPSITAKDREDLAFCLTHDVDLVALSFVRQAEDIKELKELMAKLGKVVPAVAKIEKHEAIANLDAIIKAADAIMVARGDLGVELSPEEVPIIQKQVIAKALYAGKAVIIATQMLESMVNSPRPTRAEASDVANAIFDGADAVMLSEETAIGHYPVETVATMAKIALRAEEHINYEQLLLSRSHWANATVSDAISYATCHLASTLKAQAIITSTETGRTAKQISRYRPKSAIVATTPNEATVRQLMLWWGVKPLKTPVSENIDQMLQTAIEVTKQANLVKPGAKIVITAGALVNVPGTTNLIKVETA